MTKTIEWQQQGQEKLKLQLEIDDGNITSVEMEAVGCLEFLTLSQDFKGRLQGDINALEEPNGNDHSSIIWREIISQIKEQWQSPVKQEELCHCRRVSTETVDRSIVYGAHTLNEVRARTSANTGCGTCLPDVESLLNYRLKKA